MIPVGVTTGLLFVTQDRTSELIRVGAIGSAISVIAILIGLPHGPLGVAACFALGSTLVRVPVSFWLAGRKGPVSVRDLYASIAPSLVAGGVVLVSVSGVRHLPRLGTASPLLALAIFVCAAVAVALLSYVCIPRSRRELRSVGRLRSQLFGSRAKARSAEMGDGLQPR